MNSPKLIPSVVAAIATAAFATLTMPVLGSTNVFDDAVFWFRGGKDCVTADGQMRTGEFFDDLRADDDSHANHQLEVTGYAENGVFRTENVVFPALGTAYSKPMQVLHITDIGREASSGVTNRLPLLVRPYDVFRDNSISNEYTIVCRLKLDTLSRQDWLFRIGYTTDKGLLLGFKAGSSGCKVVNAYRYDASHALREAVLSSVSVPTNMWIDVGIVVGGGKLRVGAAAPSTSALNGDNPTIVFAETPMWTENCTLTGTGSHYRFFGEKDSTEGPSAQTTGFLGSVQQIAIWGRTLSDQEVMEAFGMPRPVLFRTGFDNGASDEFGGTRSGAAQTIDGLGSWQGVWNEMRAGDTWTVNFDALSGDKNNSQVFSLRALRNSTAATIDASLNGTSLGRQTVNANARAFWPVPANLVVSGANTLTLRRADGGASAFLVDAMELGGAFLASAKVNNRRMQTGIPSAANPNQSHWPDTLLSYASSGYNSPTNIRFRVWVDPDLKDQAEAALRIGVQFHNRGGGYSITGDEVVSVFVNGVEKTSTKATGHNAWATLAVDFGAGELLEGYNDVELRTSTYGTFYLNTSGYHFQVSLPKRFSIPPSATVMIFR